jgi:lipoprotein-anchoring transpeptidase ErfK/SrfK
MARRWVYSGLIVLIVVVGAVSTLGVTRVWSESQAHGQYQSAQQAAHSALRAAAAKGLTAQELSNAKQTVGRLDATQAPQSLPVFGSERSDFYRSQARRYLAVRGGIARTVARVTIVTRQAAGSALSTFQADIGRAQTLDLDTAAPSSQATRFQQQIVQAKTPGQYRAITAKLSSSDGSLRSSITTRQAAVNAVLQANQNSLPALVASAQQGVQSVLPSLSLLSLVNKRGSSDQSTLNADLKTVTGDTQLTDAAVKMLSLNDDITAARKDVSRLLPAKMIVVSTETQYATMYQNGTQVYRTVVTTGGPELPTDHGVFHIYMKAPNFTFHSPWPMGSPYYYPPSFVQYWMPFYGGEGLHDASWRSNFGPGSNLQPTNLGTGNYILGTHGCVNMPTDAAAWTWNWAPVGTTVVVV